MKITNAALHQGHHHGNRRDLWWGLLHASMPDLGLHEETKKREGAALTIIVVLNPHSQSIGLQKHTAGGLAQLWDYGMITRNQQQGLAAHVMWCHHRLLFVQQHTRQRGGQALRQGYAVERAGERSKEIKHSAKRNKKDDHTRHWAIAAIAVAVVRPLLGQ